MTNTPTNQRTLEDAIVSGLLAVVPSLQSEQGWAHNTDPEGVKMSLATRQFTIEWGNTRQRIGGATGNLDYEVIAEMSLLAHYGSEKKNRVGELVAMDHFDVNRHFIDRLETIVGLMWWEPLGYFVRNKNDQLYEHLYDVSYMRV